MNSKNSKWCYYAWGDRKFYYTCGDSKEREAARKKAIRFAFSVTPKEAEKEFGK